MSNEEIVKQIQQGIDTKANYERLYTQNLPMIRKYVKMYSYYEDMQDLEQQAFFGLINAVERYNENEGSLFLTYAKFWILQSVQRYMEYNGSCLRIPNELRAKINHFKRYKAEFVACNGIEPSKEQISRDLGYSEKEIDSIIVYQNELQSLDVEIKGNESNNGFSLTDMIADDTVNIENDVIEQEYQRALKQDMWQAVSLLPNEEKTVVTEIYKNNLNVRQAGNKMQVAYPRARELHQRALRHLRMGKAKRLLEKYVEVDCLAYKGGVNRFKYTGESCVESIVMRRVWIERELEKRGLPLKVVNRKS